MSTPLRHHFAGSLTLTGTLFGGAASAQTLPYPPARKGDVVDDYHGTRVADPYRWLEDPDSPESRGWIDAENRLTEGYLSQIPQRAALRQRRPLRDLREVALGEPVLGVDPAPRFGGIGVLEPAIGVGDPRAVIVVDYVALAGRRVRERLRGRGAAEQDASQDQTPGEVMSKWGAHSALISGLLT